MTYNLSIIVRKKVSLDALLSELKSFLKQSKFVFDVSDLRKGIVIKLDVKSRKEALYLMGYCLKNQYIYKVLSIPKQ